MGKVIARHWFTQGKEPHFFGVVICQDHHTGERSAYIGSAPGHSEDEDEKQIHEYGAKLDPRSLMSIMDTLRGVGQVAP